MKDEKVYQSPSQPQIYIISIKCQDII